MWLYDQPLGKSYSKTLSGWKYQYTNEQVNYMFLYLIFGCSFDYVSKCYTMSCIVLYGYVSFSYSN